MADHYIQIAALHQITTGKNGYLFPYIDYAFLTKIQRVATVYARRAKWHNSGNKSNRFY
jgi:hypothetical protein